jgi:hypothetical protein
MGKAGRMPFCDASNPAAASPKVTNAAITTTTVFVASSPAHELRSKTVVNMRVPDAYTIRRKVGFFLKRLEIPVESLEFAASRAGDQLGSRESVSRGLLE